MNAASNSNERSTRSSRLRGFDSNTRKFLSDFDPQRSEREKRKLNRRLYPSSKKHAVYDEKGFLVKNGLNLCDCLQLDCTGCHFPCVKCGSGKCAHECREKTWKKWDDGRKDSPAGVRFLQTDDRTIADEFHFKPEEMDLRRDRERGKRRHHKKP